MPRHKVFRDSESEDEHIEDVNSSDENSPALSDDAVEKESSHSSDSDAEPEAVKFSDSRKNVLDRVRTAIRQLERDRQQLKAKRQKKDTVYKEQKRLKLEKLTKLPEDVLEAAVASCPATDRKQSSSKPSEPAAVDTRTDNARLPDDEYTGTEDVGAAAEDFIPLDSNTGIRAVAVTQLSKKTSTTQNAIEFHHQRSYNPQIQRDSASSFKTRSAKRKIVKAF